jgi:VWFA-related protein
MKRPASLVLAFIIALCAIAAFPTVAISLQGTPPIKAEVRLVELCATVLDRHGKYLDGLKQGDFEIRDNGEICPVAFFEPVASGFFCAILMDRTESTEADLPIMKRSILRFIDEFRECDWVAVYDFNDTLRKVQEFTREKTIAKAAVLRTIPSGSTALYDSISQVALELSRRPGKKAIVAFTDGDDNSSLLPPTVVARQAKNLGIPVYFAAQGSALDQPSLMSALREMSRATAGEIYAVKKASEVDRIFESISLDLQHSYLLAYSPPPAIDSRWRTIQLTVKGYTKVRVRTREGYYPIDK